MVLGFELGLTDGLTDGSAVGADVVGDRDGLTVGDVVGLAVGGTVEHRTQLLLVGEDELICEELSHCGRREAQSWYRLHRIPLPRLVSG